MNCPYCNHIAESGSTLYSFICEPCNCGFSVALGSTEIIIITLICGQYYFYLDKFSSGWTTELYLIDEGLIFNLKYKLDVTPKNIQSTIDRLLKLQAFV